MSGKTFIRLEKRDRTYKLARRLSQTSIWLLSGSAMVGVTALLSRSADADGVMREGVSAALGFAAGAACYALGSAFLGFVLKPTRVTADDFDAIEDEEGGFDKELLAIYQRNHGSRPMADYDAFVGNAKLIGGANDFLACCHYLDLGAGASYGQMLCYDFASVRDLVIANRHLQAKLKLSKQENEQYEYQLPVVKPASLLDRFAARPFAYTAGCCAIASLAAASITFAFHYFSIWS